MLSGPGITRPLAPLGSARHLLELAMCLGMKRAAIFVAGIDDDGLRCDALCALLSPDALAALSAGSGLSGHDVYALASVHPRAIPLVLVRADGLLFVASQIISAAGVAAARRVLSRLVLADATTAASVVAAFCRAAQPAYSGSHAAGRNGAAAATASPPPAAAREAGRLSTREKLALKSLRMLNPMLGRGGTGGGLSSSRSQPESSGPGGKDSNAKASGYSPPHAQVSSDLAAPSPREGSAFGGPPAPAAQSGVHPRAGGAEVVEGGLRAALDALDEGAAAIEPRSALQRHATLRILSTIDWLAARTEVNGAIAAALRRACCCLCRACGSCTPRRYGTPAHARVGVAAIPPAAIKRSIRLIR